ncbi:phospholipase D-like domain-containing protein [Parapedobacter koreensis]|uniref:Cardiolipin synthase n=1 Tax=Parapedobacter koreensis TaxID=332977 RepID=A0A1H7NY94_9SPHI|nr:phospholipase D-like domain-containing protein [Parapedobacter koreensis]SEL28512.1 cardiolipin synthase [Parapedobacter koreensis]
MPTNNTLNRRDYFPNHNVRLLTGGKTFFSLLIQLIEHAQACIHLQVYIYEADETGQLVADALIAAAKRGVAVYVLVDGYGSQGLKRTFTSQFAENGVHFRVFEPLFRSKHFYIGRRMHQKVLVVDARYAVVTGANIGDRYNDKPGKPAWLDFALCVSGEIAVNLCELCWTMWKNLQRVKPMPERCKPTAAQLDFGHEGTCAVRMRRNDWVRHKYDITRTYREIFRKANKRVILLSSYFLPGTVVRRDISAAVKRGVTIQLIVCSRMDVPLVKDAERSMYEWLLQHQVEIYEYTGSMLHGKLATCDDEWMTIGSFNVNDLSARVSVELNLDVRGKAFVQRTVQELVAIMENHCQRVQADDFAAKSSLLNRLIRWLAFKVLRVVFFLGTFYMKQEKYRRS